MASNCNNALAIALQEDPGKGTVAGIVGWVLAHRRALIILYLVRHLFPLWAARPLITQG